MHFVVIWPGSRRLGQHDVDDLVGVAREVVERQQYRPPAGGFRRRDLVHAADCDARGLRDPRLGVAPVLHSRANRFVSREAGGGEVNLGVLHLLGERLDLCEHAVGFHHGENDVSAYVGYAQS